MKYQIVGTRQNGEGNIMNIPPIQTKRINHTFLDGNIEEICSLEKYGGWDMYVFVGNYPTEEGAHSCECLFPDMKSIECTAFLWNNEAFAEYRDTSRKMTGLVVANDDEYSYNYAQNAFKNKSQEI